MFSQNKCFKGTVSRDERGTLLYIFRNLPLSEEKREFLKKGPVCKLLFKFSALYRVCNFNKQGIFQIEVFLMSERFETRKLSSELSIFFAKHRCLKL